MKQKGNNGEPRKTIVYNKYTTEKGIMKNTTEKGNEKKITSNRCVSFAPDHQGKIIYSYQKKLNSIQKILLMILELILIKTNLKAILNMK